MNFKSIASFVFNVGFQIGCFTLAGYFIVEQFQVYYRNEDLSYASYKKFNDEPKDLYPLLSFCIYSSVTNALLMEEKMSNITASLYSFMLQGYSNITDEFEKQSWEDITIDFLDDLLLWFHSIIKGNSVKNLWNSLWNSTHEAPFYVSYQDPYYRCFTRKWAYVKNEIFEQEVIEINATKLFANRWRRLSIYFHYQGQLIRQLGKFATVFRKHDFRSDINLFGADQVSIDLNGVEVVRQRPNSNDPCDQTLLDDDMKFSHVIILKSISELERRLEVINSITVISCVWRSITTPKFTKKL